MAGDRRKAQKGAFTSTCEDNELSVSTEAAVAIDGHRPVTFTVVFPSMTNAADVKTGHELFLEAHAP